jgi:hypothetical protein
MTAPNLFAAAVATADYADRTAALAGGWVETGGNAQIGTSTGHTPKIGTRHYTTTAPAAASGNVDSPPVAVTGGGFYSFGIWQQWLTGATPRNHRIDIRWFSNAGGTVAATTPGSQGSNTTSAVGSWVQTKRENVQAPADAVSARMRVVLLTPATSDALAFDGIQAEAGATLSSEIVSAEPSVTGVFRFTGSGWVEVPAAVTGLGSGDEWDAVRVAANEPVNSADIAVQAYNAGTGDLSAFTTVTTFSALQTALAAGQWVRVASTITATSQILVTSGAALYLDAGGKLLKGYTSSGATSSTFIRTQNLTSGTGYKGKPITPSHNVYIGGPGEISITQAVADAVGDTGGNMIGIGDNWRVRRVNWQGGQLSGSGNGGFRYMGGADLMVIGGHCDSGDDTWQVVQAGAFNDPLFDVSSSNSTFIDCTGSSSSARGLIAALQDANNNGTIGMSASINGVRFINCNVYTGGTAVAIKNTSSSGVIDGVEVIDCVLDGSLSTVLTGQAGAVLIEGSNLTGGTHNSLFRNTNVINQHKPGCRFVGTRCFDSGFFGGRLERGSAFMTSAVFVNDGIRTTIDGTVLAGLGSGSTLLTDNQSGTSNINFVAA